MMQRDDFKRIQKAMVSIAQGLDQQIKSGGPYPNSSIVSGMQQLTDFLTEHSTTPDKAFTIPKAGNQL